MNKYKTSIEDTTDVPDTASVSSSIQDIQDNQGIEAHASPDLPKVSSEPSFDISKLPSGWDNGIFFNGGESGVSSFELMNNQDLPHLIDAYQSPEILGATTDISLKGTFRLAVAVAPGFTTAAKGVHDEMNKDAESMSDNKYRALVLVSSGEIKLRRKDIKLAPAFTKAVQEAVNATGEDKSKQYEALRGVFRKYGFYYPTKIAFGGKVMFKGDKYSWLSDTCKEHGEKYDKGFPFSDIDIDKRISENDQERITQLAEQNLQHIVANGGDEPKISCGVKEWISTIAKNPEVVLRGNFRPLYDLLDNSTRRKVLNICETSIQKSWVHSLNGVHVDMEPAMEQAIEIVTGADIHYYPTGNLPIVNEGFNRFGKWEANLAFSYRSQFRWQVDERLAETDWADKVLLPGLQGYCFFACKALGNIMTEERWKDHEELITRRHVFLSPAAIKATTEFDEAIIRALQAGTDKEKFIELEKVFHMYGYYYPQWVTLGGKLTHRNYVSKYDPLKYRMGSILREESSWQASGGDISLLFDDVPDITGWLESTTHKQILASVEDVQPIYDLFNEEISAQIRQLYTKAYYQYRSRISSSLDDKLNEETALVSLTRGEIKVGSWKGIHFDGSVALEDAIELKNDVDIITLLVPVNVTGEPEIQYQNCITEFSINMSTHAFLPDGFLSRMQLNGFITSAMEYHIETGELRSLTIYAISIPSNYTHVGANSVMASIKCSGEDPKKHKSDMFLQLFLHQMAPYHLALDLDTKCIKATETLKNAVAAALSLETDMKKSHQLKKIFHRFGFYYPTCILLGGRLSVDATSFNLPDVLSAEDTAKAIDKILDSGHCAAEIIGGTATVGDRQDWIKSVASTQARIQFASMRPLYEILEVEQMTEVERLFNENPSHYNRIPKIPPSVHFDGIDAECQAIKLVKDDIVSRMTMLRDLFDQPYVEHTKQYGRDLQDVQHRANIDIDAELKFSKHMYFDLGARAAWKERKARSSHHRDDAERAYDVVYVIYKELFLPDNLLQPTFEFKEAVNNALQTGNLDHETYYALQNVFQRFGYYYSTRIQIGGRIILPSPSNDQDEIQANQAFGIKERLENYIRMCETRELNEMSHEEKNKQQNIRSKDDEFGTVIVQYNQESACRYANGELAKSIAGTDTLNVTGGDGVCLFWNDLNTWIQSVQSNQTIIKRKDLRPLYHVLDKWQRHKVRQTYKNIVLADDRIRYDCPLLLTVYEQADGKEIERIMPDRHGLEKALYRQLLQRKFDDVDEAIEFCRSACKNAGFSISKEYIDGDLFCIRCSHCEQQSLTRGGSDRFRKESFIWSIELKYGRKWRFHLPSSKHEVRHNHRLNDGNGEIYNTLSSGQKDSKAPGNMLNEIFLSETIQSSIILEIKHTALVTNRKCKTGQHVHYGDLINLRLIHSEIAAMMTLLNDELLLKAMKVGDLEELQDIMDYLKDTYISANDCLEGLADQENEETAVRNSDSDYLWKIVRFTPDSEKLGNKRVGADFHSKETEACDLSYQDCVRNSDIILFESQATLEGSKRLYLGITENKLSCFISESPTRDVWKQARWHVIRNIYDGVIRRHDWYLLSTELKTELMFSDVEYEKICTTWVENILISNIDMVGVDKNESEDENDENSDVMNIQEDENTRLANVDQSTERKIELLQARADDGDGKACYKIAVRRWETGEYQKALDMYEKAAQLSETFACYALGNIYHSGLSADHFAIAQNSQLAFMYYSVGCTYGSYPCMMKVAQYYEKGYNKLLGVQYDKARQWYMTANHRLYWSRSDKSPALLAAAKLEHSWANATSDPLEANEHRQNAFNMFHRCMESQPYAKFMVAMYHLYGWGIRQPDPGLAFNMLLSLVESGLKEVPVAIVKCYEEGVGVERDPVKAAAYREFANQVYKD